MDYAPLMSHIRKTIVAFENGDEVYSSPVLDWIEPRISLLQQRTALQVGRLLEAITTSLTALLLIFHADMMAYLAKRDVVLTGPPQHLNQIIEFIQENADSLDAADWSEFRMQLLPQPTIEHLITQRYLSGIIDNAAERRLIGIIILYNTMFFNTSTIHQEWSSGTLHKFFGESFIMLSAFKVLQRLVLKNPRDRAEEYAAFGEILSGSLLAEWLANEQ
jgi:hypothetical protein